MHVIRSQRKDIVASESVVVKQAEAVLHIRVVADVEPCDALVVRLVVLVEGVGEVETVVRVRFPDAAQSAREVTVTLRRLRGADKLAVEVAGTPCQRELLAGTVGQLLLEVPRRIAVDGGHDAGHGVVSVVYVVVVRPVPVDGQQIAPSARSLLP